MAEHPIIWVNFSASFKSQISENHTRMLVKPVDFIDTVDGRNPAPPDMYKAM